MTEEIVSLEINQIWDIMPPPLGVSIIGSKWVYFFKYDQTGGHIYSSISSSWYKQKYGIDFDETLSLVGKMTTAWT